MGSRAIQVTHQDMRELTRLIEATQPVLRDMDHLDALAAELERAEVVSAADVPADVITMGSVVRVLHLDTGREATYTLAYSSRPAGGENTVSVLAPIGMALLGYRTGDEIDVRTPGGARRLRVLEVVAQPEARERQRRRRRERSGPGEG